MDPAPPQISVVILCYKAGEQVRTIVTRMKTSLEKRGLLYELILVGNYHAGQETADTTPGIIRELAEADKTLVPVLRVKEGMFGWDVRSGLATATGDTIAFIDGDGQMPAEDVVRVYDALQSEKADMAQTFRVKRFDGKERIFISKVFNILMRIFFPRVRIHDTNAKPKIFTRDAYAKLDLHSDDWFVDAEIVIQATKLGFKVAEIPTVFLKNEHRSSFVKVSSIVEFLRNLIRYRFTGRVG